jgi:hypothetical protein
MNSKILRTKFTTTLLPTAIAVGLLMTFTVAMAELPTGIKGPSTSIKKPTGKVGIPAASIKKPSIKDSAGKLERERQCRGTIEGKLIVDAYGKNYGMQTGMTLTGRTVSGTSVRKRVFSGRDGFYKFDRLCPASYTITVDQDNRQEIVSNSISIRPPGAGRLVESTGDRQTRQRIFTEALRNQSISVTVLEKTRDSETPIYNATVTVFHLDKYTPTRTYNEQSASTDGRGKVAFDFACCGSYRIQVNMRSVSGAADLVRHGDSHWESRGQTTLALQNPQPGGAEKKVFFKRQMAIPVLNNGMSKSDVLVAIHSAGFVTPYLTVSPTSDLNLNNKFASLLTSTPRATYDERIRIAIYQISDQGLTNQFRGRRYTVARDQINRSGMLFSVEKILPAIYKSGNDYYCTENGSDSGYNTRVVGRGEIMTIKRKRSLVRGKTAILAEVCGAYRSNNDPPLGYQ